ncbi:MAG: lamin tail domain-containing protein [Anaerolineaceae bacterium]|nr:lamin tail domain-containing protein [Anaerolineaceae bacterium]
MTELVITPRSGRTSITLLVPFCVLICLLVLFLSMGKLAHVFAEGEAAAPLDVVLSEIAWMGTTVSTNDEWIELHNPTSAMVDITGWVLAAADGTPSILLSGSIPAGGYFLLERTDDTTVPGVTANQIYTGALSNTGENLTLEDEMANVIDTLDNSGGWFSGHNEARVPMLRVDAAVSANIPNNWTYNPRCGTATNTAGMSHTCTLTETAVGQSFSYQVFFNPLAITAAGPTTTTTPMELALLEVINQAATQIDIALYGLNRQSVVDSLINAHNRGVTVRVVGDDDAAAGEYALAYQALTTAGIPLILDSSGQIQHNKFLVVDSQTVWTGSTNFTDTGFTSNANNALLVTDSTLANIYTLEFSEMWSGLFHGAKADNTPHLLDYAGTKVESYFSPTDNVAFEVWQELAIAEESVHFAMFFFTDNVLSDRLVNLAESGVAVQGLFDQLGEAGTGSDADALCAAGAQIGVEDFAGKLHHKFAIIDAHGSDPTVILGSYNWTDSGAYQNDENTLIIHSAALAQDYLTEWQQLWQAIDLDRMCNPPTVYLPFIVRGN